MDRSLLNSLWQLADESFRPRADEADSTDIRGVVASNLRVLAERGFLGVGVPRDCGGLGADEVTQYEFTELLSSTCGVTAFTQQQLRVGIKCVGEGANEALKKELLPQLAAGRVFCGIALSQLRRSGEPLVAAERCAGGYRINGTIPWITAWSVLDSFVIGAALPGDKHLFAYVDREQNASSISAGGQLPLVVMRGSDTVSVELRDLFVADEHVLTIRPREELRRSDDREITFHTALPLGCARASERHLRELAQRGGREDLENTATALMFEINHWRREAITWNCDCAGHPDYKKHALRARAAVIVLAMRAAHAAVTAAGGSSQLSASVPQRLLREAQFYTTAVQTREVQAEVLDQLISPYYGM